MATKRTLVFANDQIYHVFNRGIERRTVFPGKREYERMRDTLWFYRQAHPPMTLSAYYALPSAARDVVTQRLDSDQHRAVAILAYCLMPNHFHLLLRQNEEQGTRTVVANITNSYTKYFNTKHRRIGPLFQGTFKAVRIETDEQLVHVSRYIHLNPVASFLIEASEILTYPWSSLTEYLMEGKPSICDTSPVVDLFPSPASYGKFVLDQADYARTLSRIKHLAMDEEKWREEVQTQ